MCLDLLPASLPLSTVLLRCYIQHNMHNHNVPLPKTSHRALKVASTRALTFPSLQNGHPLGLFYCSGLTFSNSTAEELIDWNRIGIRNIRTHELLVVNVPSAFNPSKPIILSIILRFLTIYPRQIKHLLSPMEVAPNPHCCVAPREQQPDV